MNEQEKEIIESPFPETYEKESPIVYIRDDSTQRDAYGLSKPIDPTATRYGK